MQEAGEKCFSSEMYFQRVISHVAHTKRLALLYVKKVCTYMVIPLYIAPLNNSNQHNQQNVQLGGEVKARADGGNPSGIATAWGQVRSSPGSLLNSLLNL